MKNLIKFYFCAIGVYEVLYLLWSFAEVIETGTAITTIADTIICAVISIFATAWLMSD